MRRHGFGRALVAGTLAVLLTLESGLTSYAAETALTGGDGAAADEAVTDGQDAADEAVADEAAANETVEDGAITDETASDGDMTDDTGAEGGVSDNALWAFAQNGLIISRCPDEKAYTGEKIIFSSDDPDFVVRLLVHVQDKDPRSYGGIYEIKRIKKITVTGGGYQETLCDDPPTYYRMEVYYANGGMVSKVTILYEYGEKKDYYLPNEGDVGTGEERTYSGRLYPNGIVNEEYLSYIEPLDSHGKEFATVDKMIIKTGDSTYGYVEARGSIKLTDYTELPEKGDEGESS